MRRKLALFVGGQGVSHAEQVPLPNKGYSSVTGPAGPGQNVGITVKEEPRNLHPTGVEMTSPALDKGNALGDPAVPGSVRDTFSRIPNQARTR